MSDDSTRTKMIKDAPVSEDMGPIKRIVKSGATKASELLDRLGIRQEKEYEGKTKEELQVKKAKGGKIGYKAGGSVSKRADGCATRGKTRGRVV
jgi:hypothetical protein